MILNNQILQTNLQIIRLYFYNYKHLYFLTQEDKLELL